MIQLISRLEVSINQRFDHISMLSIDSEDMHLLIKDDQKKRNIVKNFRIIKSAEKNRIVQEAKCIAQISKLSNKLTKNEIIVCESMVTSCINQYLNTEYVVRKDGDPNSLIDAFAYYYDRIRASSKAKQMLVIKNCGLLHELNFMGENLQFFLSNVQTSINCLYEAEKNRFFKLVKQENRSISPERHVNNEEEQQRFDHTGNLKNKKKRQLQMYCFELSKMLNLEHVYLDYYYFSSVDVDKRRKILQSNYMKRNVFVMKLMQAYQKQFWAYRARQTKMDRKISNQCKSEDKIQSSTLL